MKFEARLNQANARLKTGKVGVTIQVRGGRLMLRATFPPRPGSPKTLPYQQRLALGYHANPSGLKLAEQEAKAIGSLLDAGNFSWEPYNQSVSDGSVADWVAKFEQDYFTRRERTPESETTWRSDYLKVFSQLPPDAPLTIPLLRNSITGTSPDTGTKPDSRTRKRFVDVLSRFATFAGLEVDFSPLKGNYSPSKVTPRNLPTDRLIAEWRSQISNPQWQRVYGLIAVYGLRPHEVFKSNLEKFPILQVEQRTKTGYHLVFPLYPEWAENWDLIGDKPAVTGRNNTDLGSRVTHAFNRYNVPFPPYDLRHAWAVRSIHFGLDISLAAAQMGHSVRIHSEIYHAWINEDVHHRAYEVILSNPNRPKPP